MACALLRALLGLRKLLATYVQDTEKIKSIISLEHNIFLKLPDITTLSITILAVFRLIHVQLLPGTGSYLFWSLHPTAFDALIYFISYWFIFLCALKTKIINCI